MKISVEQIKERINEICTLFEFEYKGKQGNVDPYNEQEFLLYYDGEEQMVKSIEDVMNTPFIEGKSLNQVCESIQIIDW